MLKLCARGRLADIEPLSPEEDRDLRLAFGRLAVPEHRERGRLVVERRQHERGGRWILCDCGAGGGRPPALVPVAENHVRRHSDHPWPQHADGCDFARDQNEQRRLTSSYLRPAAGCPLRLIRRLESQHDPDPCRVEGRSYARGRDGLASLLMRLIEGAGLHRIPADGVVPGWVDQLKAMQAEAANIEIDTEIPLRRYFLTYPPGLSELLDKVAAVPESAFPRTRPHGVFVFPIAGIAQGKLVLNQGDVIPVHGRIAVFAERDGHGRDAPDDLGLRPPYLAIGLVGRPSSDAPPCVLRAYAHPINSVRHFLPVDSHLERQTLVQLLSLQSWLRKKLSVDLTIEKPVFDIGPADSDAPREPCIPDFVLRVAGIQGAGSPVVGVETMGYADDVYRTRKVRVHETMAAVLGGPVVTHDFHLPSRSSQAERDRTFWRDARWTVTGPLRAA